MRKRWVQAQKKKMRMSKKVVDENENANTNANTNKLVRVECPPLLSYPPLYLYFFSALHNKSNLA